MTRPARITVNNGDISWESQLNTNLQQLYDTPIPILLHADTLADLQSTYPAASYEWCMAIVDYDGGTTPGSHLAFSNGTAWKLASNWEFMNRRTFRGITTTDSFGDTDETIVVTDSNDFVLTLPAITDANEGRVCRVKHNGTGTVTITPTGGDTIDGAATKVTDTQFDAFEFISDGTSDWQIFGASGAGGGAADFVSLTDTPANYSGDGLKLVRVNAGEDALEFVAGGGGVTDFTDLGDVPASYSGEGGKAVVVNSGEDALEFIDQSTAGSLGGVLKYLSRGHVTADVDQTIPGADTIVELPTEFGSSGSAVSWIDANDEFVINETGTYMILTQLITEHASSHNVVSFLERDTGGGYAIIEQSTSFQGFSGRNNNFMHVIIQLDEGDLIHLIGRDLSSVSPHTREGTAVSIVKLDVTLTGGGDMEVFQQGLDEAETSAFSASMAVVDLQSSIINNAPDLYTFTAGTDVVTLNEDGLYMISYTIVADETSGTLETAAKLQKDIGAGFVDIDGSQSSGSGADQFTHGNTVIIELAATDEIKLMAQYTTSAGNAVAGTMLRIVRLKRGSGGIDYSETEQDTGRRWIDGKTIYQKTIDFGALPNATTKTVAHNLTTPNILQMFGVADNGTNQIPLPYLNVTTLGDGAELLVNDTNVSIESGDDLSGYTVAYVTLLYTL